MPQTYSNATDLLKSFTGTAAGEISSSVLSGDIAAAITAIINDSFEDGTIGTAGMAQVANIIGTDAATSAGVTDAIKDAVDEAGSDGVVFANITPKAAEPVVITSTQVNTLDAQAIIFGESAEADAVLATDSATRAVLFNGANNFLDMSAVKTSGADDGATVAVAATNNNGIITTGADDTVILHGGKNAQVRTGAGDDLVKISADSAKDSTAQITDGTGDSTIMIMDGAHGSATVNGGQGFDTVQMVGGQTAAAQTFDYVNGHFVMQGDYNMTLDNVSLVSYGRYTNVTPFSTVTVLAETEGESLVAKLYKVALGRPLNEILDGDESGPLGGMKYWLDSARGSSTTADSLVDAFVTCEEFTTKTEGKTDAQIVQWMWNNLGASSTQEVAGRTLSDYQSLVTNGDATIAQVAHQLVSSQAAVDILGQDGSAYVIDASDSFVHEDIIPVA